MEEEEKKMRSKKINTNVVVSGRPGGVELHVELSLFPGQLVVLGLFLPGQCVPLETQNKQKSREKL